MESKPYAALGAILQAAQSAASLVPPRESIPKVARRSAGFALPDRSASTESDMSAQSALTLLKPQHVLLTASIVSQTPTWYCLVVNVSLVLLQGLVRTE
jgi:hypothetical protein